LNAIQEIWNIIEDHQAESSLVECMDRPTEQLFVAISVAVVSGMEAPNTLKLRGLIHGLKVLILLDPVSSHSFINTSVASLLFVVTPVANPVRVTIANGQLL
jgi:hypothetical protein